MSVRRWTLAVALLLSACGEPAEPQRNATAIETGTKTDGPSAVEPTRISASALARAFEQNREDAELEYTAGPISIDGTVQAPAAKQLPGTLLVSTGDSTDRILMQFTNADRSRVARIKRGTLISATCRGIKGASEVTALNCAIIEIVDLQ